MASDPVTTCPDTKLTLDSDPVKTPPDTKSTMDSDHITTPPDTKPTITSDPAAIPLPTTPIVTSEIVKIPRDQASFASLPREIRDKIYHLAVPHSCDIKLFFGDQMPGWEFHLLSPQASNSTYANEACAMFFKRNKFRVDVGDLQVMLGQDGNHHVCKSLGNRMVLIPKGSFEIKPWLRDIVIIITMEKEMDELAGRVGLLLECPALGRVGVVLHGGRSVLKRVIETISGAFKALIKKFGRRLMFNLAVEEMDEDGQFESGERFIGALEKLETVARDEDSDSEDDTSDTEGDEK